MSAVNSISTAAPPSASNGFTALSSEDFIRIMTSELANQDPLAPNDSKAILEQISSIRSIESNLELKNSLESLVRQNEFASAGGLIGKFVKGLDGTKNERLGLVVSVVNARDGATLRLDGGWSVKVQDVTQVYDPAALQGPGVRPRGGDA